MPRDPLLVKTPGREEEAEEQKRRWSDHTHEKGYVSLLEPQPMK